MFDLGDRPSEASPLTVDGLGKRLDERIILVAGREMTQEIADGLDAEMK